MATGTFTHADIRRALQRANVPIDDLENATNSLLQREREAGRIRHETIPGKPAHLNDQWVRT
jgi:hypothetical protein